jgi:hypothetical protein
MQGKASRRNRPLRLGRETLETLDRPELRQVAAGLTLTCFKSCGGGHTCFC